MAGGKRAPAGEKEIAMRCTLMATALLAALVGPASARDVNPPPWDPALPNQTTQAWEFTHGPGLQPTTYNNSYGHPWAQVVSGSYWDGSTPDLPLVPGPYGQPIPTWHIDQDGGGLWVYVPNNPVPNIEKLIFWQITSDKAPGRPTSTPPGSSLPDPYGPAGFPGGSAWYTYNGLYSIPGNPPEEWLFFPFPASSNIEEIVIDTVCVPEPASLGLLACGAIALIRRRRR
jgi:hypothetical protein